MEYTRQAREAMEAAEKMARRMHSLYIGTEHLLLGLCRTHTGVAAQVLSGHGVKEQEVCRIIGALISPEPSAVVSGRPERTPRLDFILSVSKEEAARLRSDKIGTEHMLLALIRDTDCAAMRILMTMNVDVQSVVKEILEITGIDPREFQEDVQGHHSGILEQFGTDLTREAYEGRLDPVVGRQKETERLVQILSRRTKNNPCLVGEPGVGKTAVVEGLAQRIANGTAPERMREKRIISIDLPGIVAGTKYRGEFEERMRGLVQEVRANSDVILFMDELHTVIGAGGAEGAMDASNLLKPALARGEFQMIGATTITEYRKYIEKDAALERRFQPVAVEEPTQEECLQILRGLSGKYEAHHQVQIEEDALEAAVSMSARYINDRFLPDKALDVIDEACAKVSMRGFREPKGMLQKEEMVEKLRGNLEDAIRDGAFSEAALIRKEKDAAERTLAAARRRMEKKQEEKCPAVKEDDVAEVVAQWSRVPVQRLKESESARLNKLEQTLHKRVIGQDEAVSAVAKAVRRGRVGLKDPKRPIGSFLFLGPTGVGKTELSKALTEALFGSEEAMIRVDMSEYMEKHSVSKMIGSPPGYIGHDDGGQLSDQVRTHPYSVVLFDEIEKAHPDVFNILLQVLDDGHITDSQGRKVDFRNTVIIMTSNAGAQAIVDPKNLGFNAKEDAANDYKRMQARVMSEVKRIFRPEFLNRIDETLVFHPLTDKEMKRIVGLLCKDLVKRAQDQLDVRLTIRDTVKRHLVETGADKKYGARPLRRAVQNLIEDPLAEAILSGEIKKGGEVTVTMIKKKVVFQEKHDPSQMEVC